MPMVGFPDRTLDVVLEHIEDGNSPRLEYLAPSSYSRRRDSSWMPRRIETASSSSYGSCSRSPGSSALLSIKPEPREMQLGRRTCSGTLVINEASSSSRLVKPKTEPTLLPVKKVQEAIAADEETMLK
ncbi:Protein kinase APK1A, chloroplastic [Hordeum vulgare]|nr:Protein kinase APK1A, chloroplastic [Hordeum vulgare]